MPSTAILSYAYDPALRELEVRFTGGGGYVYEDVSPEDFAAFEAAPSKGAFVNRRIKPGRRFRRLNANQVEVDGGHLRLLWKRSLREGQDSD